MLTQGSDCPAGPSSFARYNQRMKIAGPERYQLSFDAEKFVVSCSKGTSKFSGLATCKRPKLYVVSVDGKLVYVGITRQSMRTRFRMGFTARGENGYHGYTHTNLGSKRAAVDKLTAHCDKSVTVGATLHQDAAKVSHLEVVSYNFSAG